ncbi:MAG: class I SAM-dependent methyltransferase [Bacillota bacterium]|nr:class I SAM-dependent methyltransferase [Bacillota bacterium]
MSPEKEFAEYENHENSVDDPEYVAYFRRFIDAAIRDYIAPGDIQCLDFGSGPEPVLAKVLERDFGWSVDIYDKFYATPKVYEGRQYDLVTATEVVEHFSDPLHYFRLFKKLLRPDGILSIMTQFHPAENEDFLNWFYIRDPSHIAFYAPKTMAVIAASLNLSILFCDDQRYITFAHA